MYDAVYYVLLLLFGTTKKKFKKNQCSSQMSILLVHVPMPCYTTGGGARAIQSK